MLVNRTSSLLLTIDIQEHLAPKIDSASEIISNSKKLLSAARVLDIPYLFTEQYPKGLGSTVADLREFCLPGNTYEKIYFSACREEAFIKLVESSGKQQIMITGTESHVCVLQTALQLKERGYDIFIIDDAVGSRRASSKETALSRMRESQLSIVNTEMVIFEWLERADNDSFRAVLPLIK